MKEIPVSKRKIFIGIILGVVIALGILIIQHWPLHIEQVSTPSNNEDNSVSKTAVFAVERIFQVNYLEGKEVWLNRICEVSTPAGCQMFSAGADNMWQKYVNAKSVVTASVQAVEKVADNGSEQVWRMTITLSSPPPGSNKNQDLAYVALMKTESGWKFDRFLMEVEINAILNHQKITASPAREGKK